LRAPIAITFIDQFGEPEAGIDGGGVFKEFFTSCCKEVIDTDRGLWLEKKRNEIYPNPHLYATERTLSADLFFDTLTHVHIRCSAQFELVSLYRTNSRQGTL
ncbi:hypothetical protein EV702DRAFT_978412, partial [Suillus placidus]